MICVAITIEENETEYCRVGQPVARAQAKGSLVTFLPQVVSVSIMQRRLCIGLLVPPRLYNFTNIVKNLNSRSS